MKKGASEVKRTSTGSSKRSTTPSRIPIKSSSFRSVKSDTKENNTKDELFSEYDDIDVKDTTTNDIEYEGTFETLTEEFHPPTIMDSPSQTALLTKRYNQKDVKSTFKRHMSRDSNPLVSEEHYQPSHTLSMNELRIRCSELESMNTFLRFKLRLQLYDANHAEEEYNQAYQEIVTDNENLHFMNELLTNEASGTKKDVELIELACAEKEAQLNEAIATNEALVQQKEKQFQEFFDKTMAIVQKNDEKYQATIDKNIEIAEKKEEEYLQTIAETVAAAEQQEEFYQQQILKAEQKIDELSTTIDSLKWGFKLRENEIQREQEVHAAAALELYEINQEMKLQLSEAYNVAYNQLAALEKHYQSEEEPNPIETVNLTIGGLVQLLKLLESAAESPTASKKDIEATSDTKTNNKQTTTSSLPRKDTPYPNKLEVVLESSLEEETSNNSEEEEVIGEVKNAEELFEHKAIEDNNNHENDSLLRVEYEEKLNVLREQVSTIETEMTQEIRRISDEYEQLLDELRNQVALMEAEKLVADEKRNKEAVAVERLLNMVASLQEQHEAEQIIEVKHEHIISDLNNQVKNLQARIAELEEENASLARQSHVTNGNNNAAANVDSAVLLEQIASLETERQATFDIFKGVVDEYEAKIAELHKQIDILEKEKFIQEKTINMTVLGSQANLLQLQQLQKQVQAVPKVDSEEEILPPFMKSVDSASPPSTPPLKVLDAHAEHHEANMQSLIHHQSFISNIAVEEEETTVTFEPDASFEVSTLQPNYENTVVNVPHKQANVTFYETVSVHKPIPTEVTEESTDYEQKEDVTLNQTTINNTQLFTTCIQDETEMTPLKVEDVSRSIPYSDSEYNVNPMFDLNTLSPLGVNQLRNKLNASSKSSGEYEDDDDDDDDEEDVVAYDEQHMNHFMNNDHKIRSNDDNVSHHLFDTPNSSAYRATPAASMAALPITATASSTSLVSNISQDSGTKPKTAEALAYEEIITEYQQRVEKLLSQLQSSVEGHHLPSTRTPTKAIVPPQPVDIELERKMSTLRDNQIAPTIGRGLIRSELEVSMSADMMAKKMKEIQQYRQELSFDEEEQPRQQQQQRPSQSEQANHVSFLTPIRRTESNDDDSGEARVISLDDEDGNNRLNSLLFSPDASFVHENDDNEHHQKNNNNNDKQQPVWMFQAANNNNVSMNDSTMQQQQSTTSAEQQEEEDEGDDSINIDFKNFMTQELYEMGQCLNEGIIDVVTQKPSVTTNSDTASTTPAASVASRKIIDMSVDESMMEPSETVKHTEQLAAEHKDESVADPINSSILLNELKLELYFNQEELDKTKVNNKSLYDLNKSLEDEKHSLVTDLSILSSRHKTTVNTLNSTKAALDNKNKEYLSLQEKMFDLLNTVKKLEQENKVMYAKSSPSSFV